MKKEFCMMAIGLLLAGCSADEEIANVQTSETNAISFNVVSNNPQTKATIINSTNDLQQWSLGVFALKDGEPFMGEKAENKDIGVKLIYQNGAWNYGNSADEHYWPHSGSLDFYAIAPYESVNISMNQILSNNQISVWTTDEIEQPGVSNDDIMYAVALGQKKDTNQGKVRLEFKHLLSQVSFKAKTSGENLYVTIASMELHNVYSSGTFTLPSNSDNDGSWSYATNLRSKYGIAQESSDVVVKPNTTTPISGSKTMLFIPQTLVPWNASTSNPIREDDTSLTGNTTESYLKIECKIWKNTSSGIHYLLGSGSGYGYSYVPFSATWESGKHYKYTLIFGGGYHKTGEEIDINPILFDVSVSDWQPATPDMDIDNPYSRR